MRMAAILSMLILILVPVFASAADDEYKFETSEFEKKPFHFGGYGEARPVLLLPDKDAAFYKLRYFGHDPGGALPEYNFRLQLEGSYEKDKWKAFFRTNTDYQHAYLGDNNKSALYEGSLSLKPSPSLTIDGGKKVFRWGKGYAWNPAAFIDRPKDPDDPELALEGFIALSADYIKSFADGPLKTVSFTPVVLPVYDHVNSDFGQKNNLNFAGKLYFLFYDTDIDFMILTGDSRTTRYGADFSRNITTNLEAHGEFAWIRDFQKNTINSSGASSRREYDAVNYLLGLRYLTATDTTYFFEYYHADTGFTPEEMEGFFSFVDQGYRIYQTTGNDALLQRAVTANENSGFGRPTPMRDYLYLRVIQKEPFDILYFTPAVTMMWNPQDQSASIIPELLYTRFKNWELRLRTYALIGGTGSEFGEKPNDFRFEFRARYYF